MSAFSSVDDFLLRLNGVKQAGRNEWKAHCPCGQNHKNGDKTQSLFVSFDNTTQKILVCCQTGCTANEICSAMGCSLADLNLSTSNKGYSKGYSIESYTKWIEKRGKTIKPVIYSYNYGNYQDGLYKVRYFDTEAQKKTFIWYSPDSSKTSGWTATRGNCPHRLFIAGEPSDDNYFIAEGEKDCLTLHKLTSVTAACSENGATKADKPGKKWFAEYNEQLKGKTVYLLWDNDKDGKKFREIERDQILKVARRLYEIDLSKIWPDIPEGADITDFVSAMGADEARLRLLDLMEHTQETKNPPQTESTEGMEKPLQKKPVPESVPVGTKAETEKPLQKETIPATSTEETASAAPQPVIPSWIVNGGINETAFAEYLIQKTGWKKTGNIIRTTDNQIVTCDSARKVIASEIAPYFPTDTQRRITTLLKIVRLYLPDAKPADEFEIKSAWELSQEHLEPPAFTVNSLLPVGLTVFAAAPKTGKSWLCLALADAIATGEKFLGFDVQRGSCLYAALEDSKFRVVDRLKKIGSDMPKSLQIVNSGAKRLDDGLLLQLESWIDRTPDSKLIVIDTLARVRPSSASGLDAYQQDTLTIAPLQALALNRGVSILIVTHYSKSKQFAADADPFDRITGSNGLFGVADAAWLIYGKRGNDELTFRTTGRDALDNEFKIAFDKESCKWSLLGTSEALEEQRKLDGYKANPIAQTIKAVVKENGRWQVTASELAVEVAKRTQTFAGDAREIGVKLAEITDYLLKDGIMWTKAPGGKRGRGYCFEPTTSKFI